MQNAEVTRQLQRLRSLFQRANEASAGEIELASHWAKYLCILSAGFLENAVKEIYIEFVRSKAPDPIASYASKRLSCLKNPKSDTFVQTARAFKSDWGHDLQAHLEEDGRREAIDAIMNFRHLIAHGREKDANITIARLTDYFEKTVQVLELIEAQCKR